MDGMEIDAEPETLVADGEMDGDITCEAQRSMDPIMAVMGCNAETSEAGAFNTHKEMQQRTQAVHAVPKVHRAWLLARSCGKGRNSVLDVS
jgi:hypothetical protein